MFTVFYQFYSLFTFMSISAMEMASKSFYAVMLETFEQEWKGEDTLKETLQVSPVIEYTVLVFMPLV